ncbi:uncharacterized protein LOC127253953 [Andrographis paniculata]|uniref:uncharacterized protein LOC127253953 n=1 Tax=Andrographis paniculata TaxID=175694 RepID=UPI0021E88468|nr:uncharacterized protein LOC127253953 [Andrographis paniculata]
MVVSKQSDATASQPLLSESQSAQYAVVLTPYPAPHRHILLRKSCQRCLFCFAFFLVFLVAAGYVLWPYSSEVSIVRLSLDRLRFQTDSGVLIDLTMGIRVKVSNPSVYSLDYDYLTVAIGYCGNRLGFVTSGGGLIKARESSYVDSTLRLDAVEVLNDAVLLIQDLENGAVMLDAASEICGKLGIFSLQLPVKTECKCKVTVNAWNQTIARQSCYPEVTEI